MDPDAALAELRSRFGELKQLIDHGDGEDPVRYLEMKDISNEALDLFEALDGWISSGGFLPGAWKKQQV